MANMNDNELLNVLHILSLYLKIKEKTNIEPKYVSPEHIVRGGIPTVRDRLLATEYGYYAVEKLLEGMSDVVICKRHNELVTMNIQYALILDRMFKDTLKPGDLDKFTPEQVAEMRAICDERHAYIERLYRMVNDLAR